METTLQQVRAEADRLGIKYHHRAGAPKIQAAINAFLAEQAKNPEGITAEGTENNYGPDHPLNQPPVVPETFEEYRTEATRKAKTMAGALIRCRIQCMNPNKKEWPGEIISVGSAKLGTFKKYIPFNGEPYHVPKIIYDMLKEKTCSVFFTTKDERGNETRKARQIKEYAIEELDPLTPKQLDDLRLAQAAARGKGN